MTKSRNTVEYMPRFSNSQRTTAGAPRVPHAHRFPLLPWGIQMRIPLRSTEHGRWLKLSILDTASKLTDSYHSLSSVSLLLLCFNSDGLLYLKMSSLRNHTSLYRKEMNWLDQGHTARQGQKWDKTPNFPDVQPLSQPSTLLPSQL